MKRLFVIAAALALASFGNAQNLIVNGGFETPALPNPGDVLFLPNGSTAVPGWVSVDNAPNGVDADNVYYRAPYYGHPASEGQHFIYIDNHSFPSASLNGIYQDFATAPGHTYQVRFDAASEFVGTSGLLRVSAGNRVMHYTLPTAPTFTGWFIYSFAFTATNNTTRLQFFDEGFQIGGNPNQGNASPLIDNVSVSAAQIAGPVTNFANGHIYYLLTQTNWLASEQWAQSMGGHLATIDDAAEQLWVYSTFSAWGGVNRALWIGLNDRQVEGDFRWASGDPVTYTNWTLGEPNGGGSQNVVHMWSPNLADPSKWNDAAELDIAAGVESNVAPLHGVVEISHLTLVGPVTNTANGHIYYLLATDTWETSEVEAVRLGGHLATINDQAEQDWVFSIFNARGGTNASFWIGLREAGSEGNYQWVSGEPLNYTYWGAGEPNNNFGGCGGESYVQMVKANVDVRGMWNDIASPTQPCFTDYDPVRGVVEIVPLVVPPSPPIILAQPLSASVISGQDVNFTVTASGFEPLTFRWFFEGAVLNGANSATLSVLDAQPSRAGSYFVVVSNSVASVTSMVVTLQVSVTLAITTQPNSVSTVPGNDVQFRVMASGSEPLTFNWFFNGVMLQGANTGTLSLSDVQSIQGGTYYAVVSNSGASITSSVVTLVITNVPVIVQQPNSTDAALGGSGSFSVNSISHEPASFQWFFKNRPIPGANAALLMLSNLRSSAAGGYFVEIRNSIGVLRSREVRLRVLRPVHIVVQPKSQVVAGGKKLTLRTRATGGKPLFFQWTKDGEIIPGATIAKLAFPIATAANSGTYSVTVSNTVSSAVSSPATVVVN